MSCTVSLPNHTFTGQEFADILKAVNVCADQAAAGPLLSTYAQPEHANSKCPDHPAHLTEQDRRCLS